MRYCPYCGVELAEGDYVFCLECGEKIPGKEQNAGDESKKRKNRKRKKTKLNSKQGTSSGTEVLEKPEEGYDGYYDDILPVDEGKIKLETNREMVKRIIGLVIGVIIIICACVAIMYLL